VISTLHHVEYARRYADRVLGLRGGRLVFDGPARELSDGAIRDIFGTMPEATGSPVDLPVLPEPELVAS
jgi:phosphonate transport system ATP-binding protein